MNRVPFCRTPTNYKNPLNGAGGAALAGGILGGVDGGFSKFAPKTGYAKDVMRIGIDGAVGGGISEMNGGSFWQGAVIASSISAARITYNIITETTTGVRAEPSLRTSDASAGQKDLEHGQVSWGFGSLRNDMGETEALGENPSFLKKCITGERSPVMRALSVILPGGDPMAEMHDPAMTRVNSRMFGGRGGLLFETISKGTIPPAYGITAAGALHEPAALATVMAHREDK